jgi:Flp pilus assembly protein CpaB
VKQADLEKQQQEQEQKVVLAATAAARQQQGKEQSGDVVPAGSFSVKTPAGKRAFTIMIDSLSAVGGLINSGDYVDILAQLQVPKGEGKGSETVTAVLFQNLQILSIGTNFSPIGSQPQYENQQRAQTLYITLALSPEEVGLLTFAQAHGKLQLTLRSPTEKGKKNIDVASWQTLATFVKENQGLDLIVPAAEKVGAKISDTKPAAQPEQPAADIQIFKSGREQ